ncbi:hypothetical protein BHE74_00054710 [Ensete ventricosum]|nr:hypothetical protein BHE74_00054710 [Ensete ventricosum]
MLAMLKGHERLRAVAAMAVVAEGDMGCDHRGSSSRGHRGLSSERVGEKLSYRTRMLRLLGIEVATWIVQEWLCVEDCVLGMLLGREVGSDISNRGRLRQVAKEEDDSERLMWGVSEGKKKSPLLRLEGSERSASDRGFSSGNLSEGKPKMDRGQEPGVELVLDGLWEQLQLRRRGGRGGRRWAVALSRIARPVLATEETEQWLLYFDGCEQEERAQESALAAERRSGTSLAEERGGDQIC